MNPIQLMDMRQWDYVAQLKKHPSQSRIGHWPRTKKVIEEDVEEDIIISEFEEHFELY
jgi:hypothetical protein